MGMLNEVVPAALTPSDEKAVSLECMADPVAHIMLVAWLPGQPQLNLTDFLET